MRKLNKSLVIAVLVAVMALATIGGVALAQDNEALPQQQGWCHGSDGVCPYGITCHGSDSVCPYGITTEARANGGCFGCHGNLAPPAVQPRTQ